MSARRASERERITQYGNKIPGDRGNYNWAVRADVTDGYVRIQQFDDEMSVVLLTPKQWAAISKFVKETSR
jgi:hypothetical protein